MSANPTDALQRKLDLEILRNEILRARILMGVFLLLGGSLFVTGILLPERFANVTRNAISPFTPLPFFGGVAVFYFFLGRRLVALDRRGGRVPLFAQYLNAFIETSFPTVGILLISSIREPGVLALNLPPAYLYFVFIILSGLRLNRRLCYFTGAVAGIQFWAVALFLTAKAPPEMDPIIGAMPFNIVKACLYIASGLLVGWVTDRNKTRLMEGFHALAERQHVTDVFGQHVSPAVVDELLQSQASSAASQSREVCVLFFDIRNFTNYSETHTPEEIVGLLNRVFSICIDQINAHNGIINKFLGDGFMAVFGAPLSSNEDTANALSAAQAIHEQLSSEFPDVQFGMGLHSGLAVTGNVGSAVRKEYTIIGDVVNLASRIEQLTKQYGSRILISSDVLERAARIESELPERVEDLGDVRVKGRSQATRIYRVI